MVNLSNSNSIKIQNMLQLFNQILKAIKVLKVKNNNIPKVCYPKIQLNLYTVSFSYLLSCLIWTFEKKKTN